MTEATSLLSTALADRYRIERQLGEGGMATVYLAEDVKHDRRVALKVLRPELAAVLGAERFIQEIKTTAALQHPHILPLFDSGEAGGFLFYVMPYVEGETLRDRLNRETQLGIEDAVRITTDVADALDYAHRHGVVHRDIKPENILLHDGRPMVADFGIALAVSAAAGGRMTETGMSLGTPHYMSPEQATAEKNITARSDVYSLGGVLYEMLTGETPHMGNSAQAIIMKIVTEEAQSVTRLRKSVPPNVSAAVAKALERLPADRFESAKAFAEALANAEFSGPVRHRAATGIVAAGAPLTRQPAVLALGVATVLAVALAAWVWLRPTPDPPTTRQWVGLSLVRGGGALPASWHVNLAIASDGSAIVFGDSVGASGAWQLFLKERASPTAVPIPGTIGGFNPFFSPDGNWIGFATDRGLFRIPRSGGAPVQLSDSTAHLPSGVFSSGAWLDDGTIVFAGTDNRHLFRVDVQGGNTRVVLSQGQWFHPDGRISAQAIVHLEGLPHARGVLITTCAAAPCSPGALWMLDLERDTVVQLADGVSSGWYLPTGHVLYGRPDGTLFAQRLDLDRGELTGAVISVMSGLWTSAGIPALALSPAGTVLYALRGDGSTPSFGSSLVWVDRDGTTSTLDSTLALPGIEQGQGGLSLSPDGSRLALVQNTEREGPHIFVRRMPDGPTTRLTFENWNGLPAWSPDGRDIVYVGFRNGAPSAALRRPSDGAGAATVIAEESRSIQEALLSPDGEWVVYRTDNVTAGNGDILGRRLAGDTTTIPLIATPAQEAAPAISPDGRWLAYTSDEGGQDEVFVRPWPEVNGGKWRVSRDGGTEPVWSANGRELYFRSRAGQLMAAQVNASDTFDVSDIRSLFPASEYLTGLHAMYAVSADGQRFLFGRSNRPEEPGASKLILVHHWFTELRPLLEGR